MSTNTSNPLQRIARRLNLAAFSAAALLTPILGLADTVAPSPNLKKAPPAWAGLGVMFLLAALVISVSLLPAKRGHQD